MLRSGSIIDALAARVRRDGSRPLLTYYHPARGERTEFSAKSFANWVDKTANLLESLGVEQRVAGPVSVTHPGHWMSLVWPLAAWQRGLCYLAVEPPLPDDAELAVIGPEHPEPLIRGATIACSLHPFGLGLGDLPDGVLDYSTEALAEPDAHLAVEPDPQAPAWMDRHTIRSHAAIQALDPQPDRVLLRPGPDSWPALAEALLRPLLGGGSAVIVAGPVDATEAARIITSERVDHTVSAAAEPPSG